MRRIDRLRAYQVMESKRPDAAPTWKGDLRVIVELFEAAHDWAHALDRIHEKVFTGPGPHPELEEFQAREKALRDLALSAFDAEKPDFDSPEFNAARSAHKAGRPS